MQSQGCLAGPYRLWWCRPNTSQNKKRVGLTRLGPSRAYVCDYYPGDGDLLAVSTAGSSHSRHSTKQSSSLTFILPAL